MKTTIAIFLISLLLGACASSELMNNVSTGMTKSEVIAGMGPPDHSKAKGGEEFLIYSLYTDKETTECAGIGIITLGIATQYCGTEYFVHLKDGKVFSYGRTGDYGIKTEKIGQPVE